MVSDANVSGFEENPTQSSYEIWKKYELKCVTFTGPIEGEWVKG